MPKAKISALGCYTPPGVLTNEDLEEMVDTDSQWIVERTGMPETAWSRTITALKSREAVIQHGDRRGARYELRID